MGLLVVAAIGVGALVAQAYEHTTSVPHSGEAAPVPTFTLGVQTPTPTPTPIPVVDRATERYLAVGWGAGANVWWRGIAGACGGAAPVVEQSTDGGATWTNVTPPGVTQLASIDAFDQTEAELVVGVGANCEPQALRTFTQGQFWESYPDVLAASRFVALADPATSQLRSVPVAAPCPNARGLRADGDLVALICDGVAYSADATDAASSADVVGTWAALPAPDAAALAIDGDSLLVAHSTPDCAGVTLTRFIGADPAQPESPQCLAGADPTQPTALTLTDAGTLVWSGDTLVVIPR